MSEQEVIEAIGPYLNLINIHVTTDSPVDPDDTLMVNLYSETCSHDLDLLLAHTHNPADWLHGISMGMMLAKFLDYMPPDHYPVRQSTLRLKSWDGKVADMVWQCYRSGVPDPVKFTFVTVKRGHPGLNRHSPRLLPFISHPYCEMVYELVTVDKVVYRLRVRPSRDETLRSFFPKVSLRVLRRAFVKHVGVSFVSKLAEKLSREGPFPGLAMPLAVTDGAPEELGVLLPAPQALDPQVQVQVHNLLMSEWNEYQEITDDNGVTWVQLTFGISRGNLENRNEINTQVAAILAAQKLTGGARAIASLVDRPDPQEIDCLATLTFREAKIKGNAATGTFTKFYLIPESYTYRLLWAPGVLQLWQGLGTRYLSRPSRYRAAPLRLTEVADLGLRLESVFPTQEITDSQKLEWVKHDPKGFRKNLGRLADPSELLPLQEVFGGNRWISTVVQPTKEFCRRFLEFVADAFPLVGPLTKENRDDLAKRLGKGLFKEEKYAASPGASEVAIDVSGAVCRVHGTALFSPGNTTPKFALHFEWQGEEIVSLSRNADDETIGRSTGADERRDRIFRVPEDVDHVGQEVLADRTKSESGLLDDIAKTVDDAYGDDGKEAKQRYRSPYRALWLLLAFTTANAAALVSDPETNLATGRLIFFPDATAGDKHGVMVRVVEDAIKSPPTTLADLLGHLMGPIESEKEEEEDSGRHHHFIPTLGLDRTRGWVSKALPWCSDQCPVAVYVVIEGTGDVLLLGNPQSKNDEQARGEPRQQVVVSLSLSGVLSLVKGPRKSLRKITCLHPSFFTRVKGSEVNNLTTENYWVSLAEDEGYYDEERHFVSLIRHLRASEASWASSLEDAMAGIKVSQDPKTLSQLGLEGIEDDTWFYGEGATGPQWKVPLAIIEDQGNSGSGSIGAIGLGTPGRLFAHVDPTSLSSNSRLCWHLGEDRYLRTFKEVIASLLDQRGEDATWRLVYLAPPGSTDEKENE